MTTLVDFPVTPEARPYLDAFVDQPREPRWLRDARRQGLDRFARLGFPNRRSEDWRYLDLRRLEAQPMLPAASNNAWRLMPEDVLDDTAPRLVLVDGALNEKLSRLPSTAGMWFRPMRDVIVEGSPLFGAFAGEAGNTPEIASRAAAVRSALDDCGGEQPFAALNTAFFSDGFVLDIAPGTVVDKPIQIFHIGDDLGASFHTRNLINLGAGSRVTILETYLGLGGHWRNDVASWRVGEGATLTRIALIDESDEAVHLERIDATLAAKATLETFVLLLQGRTVRHEVNVTLAGDHATCRLDGAFIASRRAEANIVTAIDHAATGGTTSELIKGVAAGQAHGAFQGKIIVREGAQQTDARQTSRNLILGRRASIDTKPELEILADDVKCAHGASVGELDEAALFYLRARGIPLEEARRLLVEGFLAEAIDGVANPAIREHLLRRLSLRLARLEEWS